MGFDPGCVAAILIGLGVGVVTDGANVALRIFRPTTCEVVVVRRTDRMGLAGVLVMVAAVGWLVGGIVLGFIATGEAFVVGFPDIGWLDIGALMVPTNGPGVGAGWMFCDVFTVIPAP